MVAEFPKVGQEVEDRGAVEEMEWVKSAISAIRNIRGELSISPSQMLGAIVVPSTHKGLEAMEKNRLLVERLARVSDLEITTQRIPPKWSVTAVTGILEVFIPIDEAQFMQEKRRLEKGVQKVEKDLEFVRGKLSNEAFLSGAPAEVVEKEKGKQTELEKMRQRLEEGLRRLETTH